MIDRRPVPATTAPGLLPRHVAIVMDGNRRWAAHRRLPTVAGHLAGAAALREIVLAAAERRIAFLTVHAFGPEHRGRDAREIAWLMDVMRIFAERDARELCEANVRVGVIGHMARLPTPTRAAIERLVSGTRRNDGLCLNLALDYGARSELCDAIRRLARDVENGSLAPTAIDDDSLGRYLATAGIPDPDFLISTGGGLRVANFLLYQIAYAELWSTPTLWPDFDPARFEVALAAYASRQRRFGS